MVQVRKCIINFVLASNNAESITRLVAEYSRHLAAKDFHVVVSYPMYNYWDFTLWKFYKSISKNLKSRIHIYLYLGRLVFHVIKILTKRLVFSRGREWAGELAFSASDGVALNPYSFIPTGFNMPDADYLVVMQEYLIPRLLHLPEGKGRLVGSIHLDYGDAIKDDNELLRHWWAHNLCIVRQLNVPLWTTSLRTKRSCDNLGINIRRIIYNGIDVNKFKDGKRRGRLSPLRIMLYCDIRPQKGREIGINVIKLLKETENDDISYCSIGHVTKEQKEYFDVNFGWVVGDDYIRAYQETDIFIFPSLYEGFPAPPLDAMACGCALATTNVQGVEEYGVHEQNCMKSDPGDVEKMVKNVIALINDVSLRDQIRKNGLLTAQRFSWEAATEELIDFLNTCGDR